MVLNQKHFTINVIIREKLQYSLSQKMKKYLEVMQTFLGIIKEKTFKDKEKVFYFLFLKIRNSNVFKKMKNYTVIINKDLFLDSIFLYAIILTLKNSLISFQGILIKYLNNGLKNMKIKITTLQELLSLKYVKQKFLILSIDIKYIFYYKVINLLIKINNIVSLINLIQILYKI